MAEVIPRHYLFGILMFTLFFVGGTLLIAEFQRVDDGFVNQNQYQEFNRTFDTQKEIVELLNKYDSNITNSEPDQGTFGVLNSLISSSWGTLKLLGKSLTFMKDAAYGTSSFFGVPTMFVTLIIGLITIMIIFSIWSAIFQKDM